MTFNDKNFMLKNEPAKKLYCKIAELPIYDFHCHLDPKEIFEDKVYEDIVDLWLGGDHYKWRLMRANGISEEEITGSAVNWPSLKPGQEPWNVPLEILFITGAIWNCDRFSVLRNY